MFIYVAQRNCLKEQVSTVIHTSNQVDNQVLLLRT